MQTRNGSFVRARNTASLGWYGDPERWGSSSVVSVPVAAREAGVWTYSSQLVRGQTSDLVACSWETFCAVDYGPTYDPDHDAVTVAVELAMGVGQSSQIAYWYPQLNPDPNADRMSTRLSVGGGVGGLARHMYAPIIGAAIAGRVAIHVESTDPGDRVLAVTATLAITPRPGYFQGAG
jgi:hypothetical protein